MSLAKKAIDVVHLAKKIVPAIATEFGNGSNGGYLYFGDNNNNKLFLIPVGRPADAKKEKYASLAEEKATRLYQHPTHDLSWQSMNEEMEQYQGAIKLVSPYYAFMSFSGFPAPVDEGLCLVLSRKSELLSPQGMETLSNISGNYALTHRMWDFAKKIW